MIATCFGRCWLRSIRPVLPGDWPRGGAVFAIWHEDALLAGALFRRLSSMALVSRSRDGQILADILSGGRLVPVRGSSSGGAMGASREILRGLKAGVPLVTALDGPRGPARSSKPGASWFARQADVPLFLLGFGEVRCARAGDWSRLRLPMPFSRPNAVLERLP